MTKLEGKVALITGALGGIGQWYAKSLLENKVKGVALWDINEAAAQKFLDELKEDYGAGKAIFIKVDVTKVKEIEDAFERTVNHFKQLDIVINNAGIIEEEDIQKCVQVNLVAVAVSTNLAMTRYLPAYRNGAEGIVVNTSSMGGLAVLDYMPTYIATKHGVVALGRSLGQPSHYDLYKVRVLTICPGITESPMAASVLKLPKSLNDMRVITEGALQAGVQSAEVLGRGLIKVLLEGKNGSVWIVYNGNPAKEFDFTVVDNATMSQFL